MDLYLRKIDHPQAPDSYRVILKIDEIEFEIGSIGSQGAIGAATVWAWGIDTVVPMREIEAEGCGADLRDSMQKFRAAWQRFSADPARLTEFLETKRRARR
jgi:hypothetical protein